MDQFKFLALILIVSGLILFLARARHSSLKAAPGGAEDRPGEYDAEFLAQAKGRSAMPLVRVYNSEDLMVLRSLLSSAGIPNYVNYGHISGLYPNIRIAGLSDSVIAVFDTDLDDALRIVLEYIELARKNSASFSSSKVRAVAEFVVGGYVVPGGSGRTLPEVLVEGDAVGTDDGNGFPTRGH
ncbi:MAG TPA: hypothetical protein PK625_01625 [Spirochaetales bacterium]|nr:hypothetical protein [Spirochaetales bacterium]